MDSGRSSQDIDRNVLDYQVSEVSDKVLITVARFSAWLKSIGMCRKRLSQKRVSSGRFSEG